MEIDPKTCENSNILLTIYRSFGKDITAANLFNLFEAVLKKDSTKGEQEIR